MQHNSLLVHRTIAALRAILAAAALGASSSAAESAATHPLDPLDANELVAIRDILTRSDRFSPGSNFAWIALDEPSKAAVGNFKAGSDFPRRAKLDAIDYQRGKTYRVLIDLRARRILSVDDLGALQPGLTDRDGAITQVVVDADPRFKEALIRRGLKIPGRVSDSVRIRYMPFGVDRTLDAQGYRLMRVLFASDQLGNSDTSPFIDGLMAVVDVFTKSVVRFTTFPARRLRHHRTTSSIPKCAGQY